MKRDQTVPRILLVDDDVHFRHSLAIGMELAGLQVVELAEGLRALEFLLGNQGTTSGVAYVVVDARMPGLDGFWLSDQIHDLYPNIRVLILSAHRYHDLPERYTLLEKPVKMDRLLAELGLSVVKNQNA
ncbi:response regulator [bacterium]|nr:response regulator [bacterium]